MMNRLKSYLTIGLAVWALSYLALPAGADAPMIFCTGTACHGDGPRPYAYKVDAASYPMMDFRVGTNDLYQRNYTAVLIPAGWNFAVERVRMSHDCGMHTPHGKVSPGPCRCLTAGSVHWWTDDPQSALESFTFGYDHPGRSEDVGWILATRRPGPPVSTFTFKEDWNAAVGFGYGPVHGPIQVPIPEPTTLILLGLGCLTLLPSRFRPLVARGGPRPFVPWAR